jgi:hypothetical protein
MSVARHPRPAEQVGVPVEESPDGRGKGTILG